MFLTRGQAGCILILYVEQPVVHAVYHQIGKRIGELRRLRVPPLSQQDLAKRVGLTRVSITNIENGRHRIQVHTLYAIARALEVPIVQLLPGSLEPTSEYPFAQPVTNTVREAIHRMTSPKRKGARNAGS
jgi:DNA-binding XRE family transcriptional regulator